MNPVVCQEPKMMNASRRLIEGHLAQILGEEFKPSSYRHISGIINLHEIIHIKSKKNKFGQHVIVIKTAGEFGKMITY